MNGPPLLYLFSSRLFFPLPAGCWPASGALESGDFPIVEPQSRLLALLWFLRGVKKCKDAPGR
jgi:hypothetical protein